MIYAQVDQMYMACGIHDPCCLKPFYSNRASDNILEFVLPWIPMTPCPRLTVTLIIDSYDHFSTVTIIFWQLRSYLLDSYDNVADVWFVSYDYVTKVSQAHFSKTNGQTNNAWHAKPRLKTPMYCVQIREHSVAYMCQNRARPDANILFYSTVCCSVQCIIQNQKHNFSCIIPI